MESPAVPFKASRARELNRAARLSIISALARAPGFLVPVLIAATFGAGRETDAYFIAYAAALVVGGTISQGVEVAIVPFSAREISARGRGAIGFVDRGALGTGSVALLIWGAAIAASYLVVRSDLRQAATSFGLSFAPLVLAWCASSAYSGTLIARDAIGVATGTSILRGAGGVIALVAAPRGMGLTAVALGLGVGEVARTWWMRRTLMRRLVDSGGGGTASVGFAKAAFAQVTAVAIGGTAPLGERVLATTLGAGGVSHLEYAARLLIVPQLVFDGALSPILLSRWSREIAARGHGPTRREVVKEVLEGMGVALVLGAALALTAPFWVRLILRHGHFSDVDAAEVGDLLRLLSIGFVFSMGAVLLERYFMAAARNRTLAMLSVLRVLTRLGVAFAFITHLGLRAFACGFAGGELVYLLTLTGALWRRPSDLSVQGPPGA